MPPAAAPTSSTPSSGTRRAPATGRSPSAAPSASTWPPATYDQATVDRFDEVLDDGTDALVRDLKRLMRANMEDEVERFSAALHAGAILPEDF